MFGNPQKVQDQKLYKIYRFRAISTFEVVQSMFDPTRFRVLNPYVSYMAPEAVHIRGNLSVAADFFWGGGAVFEEAIQEALQ